jgi:NADH:ubiquinone oxidoreductase subunit 3 (subunit A)
MALLIDVLMVAGLCAAMLSVNRVLGPRMTSEGDRGMPYETGMPPLDSAALKMTVPYVRFALLFVVFDVELALLLPAATLRDRLDLSVMMAITGFLALFTLMLAYLWRKGALHCD